MIGTGSVGDKRELEWFVESFEGLVANLAQVVKGSDEVLRNVLICLVAEGHVLIEDVPGVGKTTIARAMAASLDMSWNRIQFTPDLLPSDVTGVSIFNQRTSEFEFRPGPVFSNILVGDEINRASPKTQSALLEVMEEGRVTVDGVAHAVPSPFMVIATQNPVEMDGTYRLPEAQLDRFLMRVSVGYPSIEAEREVLRTQRGGKGISALEPVAGPDHILKMIEVASRVHISPALEDYLVRIVAATRELSEVRLGVSPRGTLALARSCAALAVSKGRGYVTPEDVKELVVPVLAHRMILGPEAELRGRSTAEVLIDVLANVNVPHDALTP